MKVAADISLYPITNDFIPPIDDVIERLRAYESLKVDTNPMSTQIRGDYDEVMSAISRELKTTFEKERKAVFVIKILNNPITG
jgi:uncharacterized protein YqgV (UPF0045/DUF77 family)